MINVAAALNRYANLLEFADLLDIVPTDPYEDDPTTDMDELVMRFRTGTAGKDLLRKALALQSLASELVELGSIGDLDETTLHDMAYRDIELYALDFVEADTRTRLVGMLDESYEL